MCGHERAMDGNGPGSGKPLRDEEPPNLTALSAPVNALGARGSYPGAPPPGPD